MFDGCSQLVLQHIMFDPGWDAACPGCSAGLDEMAPALLRHLRSRDTAFAGVSRAPSAKLASRTAPTQASLAESRRSGARQRGTGRAGANRAGTRRM
jgi:predicted dithiol-disulfide oxidoreductase (DUF899 family)